MREQIFFLLLRLGLQTESPQDVDHSEIKALSSEDWQWLKDMATQQGVLAIIFDGLRALTDSVGTDSILGEVDRGWWRNYILGLYSFTQVVERNNAKQMEVIKELASVWYRSGCQMMLMKGQANGIYYPQPNHRQPGDVDVYFLGGYYERANQVARGMRTKVDESWYKHSQIIYRGEMFENHQFFVHTRDGGESKHLNSELTALTEVEQYSFMPETYIYLPPVAFNALFLTYHAMAHFLEEGLKMKQVVDWAMFLEKEQNNVDWKAYYQSCERYHLHRFADAMTTIAIKYLGVNVTTQEIKNKSPYADRLLHSTLYDNDYVFSSGEGGWRNRLHIVRNLFKYRWKYRDIYQRPILKQLYYYATGYLFKTE